MMYLKQCYISVHICTQRLGFLKEKHPRGKDSGLREKPEQRRHWTSVATVLGHMPLLWDPRAIRQVQPKVGVSYSEDSHPVQGPLS